MRATESSSSGELVVPLAVAEWSSIRACFFVWASRNGELASVELFAARGDALEAVGLRE